MELIQAVSTTRRRVNGMVRSGQQIWLGFEDAVEVRDETTGDILHEFDMPAFHLSAIRDTVWVVSNDNLLCVCPTVSAKTHPTSF